MAVRDLEIDVGLFPRSVRWPALALLALALTTLFAIWIFPYARLARAISARSEALVGIRLELGDLAPELGLAGPGLAATNVRATLPRGETLLLPRVFLRPALSLRWLRGAPSFAVDLDGGGLGTLDGEVAVGAGGGFRGTLDGIALALLPLDQAVPGLSMEGRVSGDVDIATNDAGRPEGRLAFVASDGNLVGPGLPIAVPFARFEGDLELGGAVFAQVAKLELDGPMLFASATGTVALAEVAGQEPLDLALEIRPIGDDLAPILAGLGIPAQAGQTTKLRITGTLARPTFR